MRRFEKIIRKYRSDRKISGMQKFIQHGNTTTLDHCEAVARTCIAINRRLHLNIDEEELIQTAMLHDYYLYDWHDGNPVRKTHGFDHPEIACDNAVRDFQISKVQQDAIRSHMWPLTITKIPRSREAIVLCAADKYCALLETIKKV